MTLVDTNILLDLVTNDRAWLKWSIAALEAASLRGPLFINDIVYAELSVGYSRIEDVDAFIEGTGLVMAPITRTTLFLAGKVFTEYRKAGGLRTSVLPDFIVGAHAASLDVPLLTRDARRYRTYFPTIKLISP